MRWKPWLKRGTWWWLGGLVSSGHSLRWCKKYSQSHVACSSNDWLQLFLFSIARDCVRLKKKNQSSTTQSWPLRQFQLSVESNLGLHRFCFTSLCDWFRKLAPLSRPIRYKTKANYDLVARVFPRFRQFACFLVLIGSLGYFSFFWLAIVITMILGTKWRKAL